MNTNIHIQSITAKLLLASALACAGGVAMAKDVTVGISLSLSGPNASIGVPYQKGVDAALEYLHANDGPSFRVRILDDNSNPTVAKRNAEKLVEEEHADVIIGTSGVPAAIAMTQVARDSKTPMVGITPIMIDALPQDWVTTVAQPAELMVEAVVDRMAADGVKTVGFIGYSDGWGDLNYNSLIQSVDKHGIKVVGNERYARGDSSVTGQVLKLLTKKPDAIMNGGSGTPGALPFLELQKMGYKGKLYGNHGLINDDFLRIVGDAGKGAIMPTGPVIVARQLPDSNPTKAISLEFFDAYRKANNADSDDAFSAYSFDAFLVIAEAVRKIDAKLQPGTAAFREALNKAIFSTKELKGTHGVFNFEPGSLYGSDTRARVLVSPDNEGWKLISE